MRALKRAPLALLPLRVLGLVASRGVGLKSVLGVVALLVARAVLDAISAALLALVLVALLHAGAVPMPRFGALLSFFGIAPGHSLPLLLAALALCKAVFAPALGWLRGRAIDRWTLTLSLLALRHELQQPAGERAERHAQGSNVAINHGVPRLVMGVVLPSLDLLTEGLVAALLVLLLLGYAAAPAGVLLLTLALGFAVSRLLLRRLRASAGGLRERNFELMQRWVTDSVACLREIHLYRRIPAVLAAYRPVARRFARSASRQRVLMDVQGPLVELSLLLALGAALLLVGAQAQAQAPQLASLALFSGVGLRLMPALRQIGASLRTLSYNRPVFDDFVRHVEPAAPLDAARSAVAQGADGALFECRGLQFRYPDGAGEVIAGLDLRCRSGEWLGLVGESGAGKSTLVDLLIGELQATGGSLAWQGGQRPQIGYAGATTTLIPGTLRDNLSLLGPPRPDAELHAALAIAGAEHLVARLPEGLDTALERIERRISSGERQRLGLARAVLHAGDLLVLDEATAALDQLSENAFLQRLRTQRPTLAVLLVTHRLGALVHTERNWLLVDGRLQAFSAPAQLPPASAAGAD